VTSLGNKGINQQEIIGIEQVYNDFKVSMNDMINEKETDKSFDSGTAKKKLINNFVATSKSMAKNKHTNVQSDGTFQEVIRMIEGKNVCCLGAHRQ